jgi:hypothetical protein
MIEILGGKSEELNPAYSDPRPVLRVTHQLKREHVIEIVRFAVERYGLKVLQDECGLRVADEQAPDGAFYCWVPGRSHPVAEHPTAERAYNEAVRLIEVCGADKVVVSRSIRVYKAMPHARVVK